MPDHLVVARRGAPAVVVVHDRYGLLPEHSATVGALAEAGFTAVAVDLYDGRIATDGADAARLSDALDRVAALQRLAAAVRDLRRAEVLAPRIAAIGYGMGGTVTLEAAAMGLFDAVVVYGASAPAPTPLPCPVLLHDAGGAHHAADTSPTRWQRTLEFLGPT